jgi:F0F1-type ATP synthase assembly protein I
VAVLIGALVHGFAHTGIDPFGLIIGSLLYGLPTALLFIKKDFEHAVGYHFLIDFVRFMAALLNG